MAKGMYPQAPVFGPMAGYFGGIDLAQEEEKMNLSNLASMYAAQKAQQEASPESINAERAYKQAMTENYLAMARGLGHYEKQPKVDPKKTAEAQASVLSGLHPALAGIMEPYLAAKEQGNAVDMSRALGVSPSGDGGMYLEEVAKTLEEAGLTGQAAALRRGTDSAEGFYKNMPMTKSRTELTKAAGSDAARIRVAEINKEARLEAQRLRNAAAKTGGAKTAKNEIEQGNIFYNQAMAAEASGEDATATQLYARAQQFYSLGLQKASAGAATTAGAKPDLAELEKGNLRERGKPTQQLPGKVDPVDEFNRRFSTGRAKPKTAADF